MSKFRRGALVRKLRKIRDRGPLIRKWRCGNRRRCAFSSLLWRSHKQNRQHYKEKYEYRLSDQALNERLNKPSHAPR